ncbi:MAG: M23 family metallopeptidase [Candidatus Omnitrophica bacterium]|nr:M23 family metallopeptidase [Candidatus Omnitrophota bacterium]
MKRFLVYSAALCVVCALCYISCAILFPLFFKLTEPVFIMPLHLEVEVSSAKDLPVRYDAYGNGEFGSKRRGGRKHSGLDIAAKMKTPVCASKSGWGETFFYPTGYGHLVIIKHPGGWQTRYGHLHECAIKKPQWVWRGSLIGYVGKSGNASTSGIMPHLHFEIRYKNKPLDPVKFLVPYGRPWVKERG